MQGSWKRLGYGWLVLDPHEQLERITPGGASFPWLSLTPEPLSLGVFVWNYLTLFVLGLLPAMLIASGAALLAALGIVLLIPVVVLGIWLNLSAAITIVVLIVRLPLRALGR